MAGKMYTQPYMEALRERMEWFKEEDREKSTEDFDREDRESADDDDDVDRYGDDDSEWNITHPRATTRITRMISINRHESVLVGNDMSGDEVCRLPLEEGVAQTILWLRTELAEVLGSTPSAFTAFQGSTELSDPDDVVAQQLVVRQVLEEPTLFVCRKVVGREPMLGEGSVRLCLPEAPLVQALQENHSFVTSRDSYACWVVYSKAEVSLAHTGREEPLTPLGIFPPPPAWRLPPKTRSWGGPRCDVWTSRAQLPAVQPLLDAHAELTGDRPIPRYQMIVDPNQFVHDRGDGGGLAWVPCEFDVDEDGRARLVGGARSHVFPELAEKVATPVLTAAMPLLARLKRPRLLLDRRRLQVVFKAQRIIVPPKASDEADAEYVGLWHMDGQEEHVAAVVLYYYRVDPSLSGGDMEFCGREPLDVLGYGDCSNNFFDFRSEALRSALRPKGGGSGTAPACRVPIKEGTLLVFSNYQMIHRVLRMLNSSTSGEASRDFVALFVLDPSVKPLVPARAALAKSYITGRTLLGGGVLPGLPGSEQVRRLILEYVGEVPTLEAARKRRNQMLRKQLQPQGQFAGARKVYATGNGCFSMIGWLDQMLDSLHDDHFGASFDKGYAWSRLYALNLPPRQDGRGISEILSMDSADLESRAEEVRRCRPEGQQLPPGL